jgi:hypothetical protein
MKDSTCAWYSRYVQEVAVDDQVYMRDSALQACDPLRFDEGQHLHMQEGVQEGTDQHGRGGKHK